MEKTIDLKDCYDGGKEYIFTTDFYLKLADGKEASEPVKILRPTFSQMALVIRLATLLSIGSVSDDKKIAGFTTEIVVPFSVFVAVSDLLTNVDLPDGLDAQWFVYKTTDLNKTIEDVLDSFYGSILSAVNANVRYYLSQKTDNTSKAEEALSKFLASINEKVEDVSFEELTKILSGVAEAKEELKNVDK